MPTGPVSSSYIIPPLTLSDTFYEWYVLTNNEVIDKLNRMKVYQIQGATGISSTQNDDGVNVVYLADSIPGDHIFTGNITFNGTVTTVNTNLVTIDDYNLVLGAVGAANGGTSDTVISNAGGGGLVIAGACGDKYFLWKAFDAVGKTFNAWRISDALAFTGDAKFYSNNNRFEFREGSTNTSKSKLFFDTPSAGTTIEVCSYFSTPGATYPNMNIFSDGSSQMIDSSVVKRFTSITNINSIGITFGKVIRHNVVTGGITLAMADNSANAESIGVVVYANNAEQVVHANMFGYMSGNFSGAIASADSASSLGTGEFYFLSPDEPGKITKTVPSISGQIRKPILYALGGTKALVMNYVGNKVLNIESLYSKLSASTVIIQHEPGLFAIGDVVRFEEGVTASARPYGSYVKASNIDPEQAEALGVVSSINYGGSSASSMMTVSGYIDMSGSGMTLEPGSVYFLSNESGKLTTTVPTTVNTVRKPMIIAVSPTAGIIQNYVGLLVGSNTVDQGTAINASQYPGFRNKLINGNFDIWQRGFTFGFYNPDNVSRYTADRWKIVNTGGTTADRFNITATRKKLDLGELSGSNINSKYAMELSLGTGGFTGTSQTYLMQRVEGVENLPNGYATISFYAKATIPNSRIGVSFRRDFGGGTAPDYTLTGVEANSQKLPGIVMNLPTTWTRFSHTFALPNSKNGIVGALGTDGPEIRFFIRAGSDLVTSKDVVEALNPTIAGVSDYKIYIAQVQLEEGTQVTPFELLDRATEVTRCQRYYQTSHPGSEDNVRPFDTLATTSFIDDQSCIDQISAGTPVYYPVNIRNGGSATITFKSPTAATVSVSSLRKSSKGFRVVYTGPSTFAYSVESEL